MNEILFLISIAFYLGGVLFAYKIFGKTGLYVWTAISAILANIEALKMVDMFGLSVTLGNALYASSFVVTDILSEKQTLSASLPVIYYNGIYSLCQCVRIGYSPFDIFLSFNFLPAK